MELPIPPTPDDELSQEQPSQAEPQAPLRKRQRQNLQDVSNTKPLAPIRASGRIRIKMTAAAESKPPEPTVKPVKVVFTNSNINKQRRRTKKLKTDLVSELAIDVKRPSSVLVDTSIRALLTNVAFSQLSPENQKILIESLPLVDRPPALAKENHGVDLNPSSINNEFFNRACIEWRDRLSNGEFTNEHQTKLRAEQEREKSKIDPWKARNFEGIWGIKSNGHGTVNVGAMMEKSAMEMKDRVEQGDFEIPEGFISEVWKREATDDENIEIKEEEDEEEEEEDDDEEDLSYSPSQQFSVLTPPEIVTSTLPELSDSPEREPSPVIVETSPELPADKLVIAEATSTAADDISMSDEKASPIPSTSDEFIPEDDFAGEIASHVELSTEGVPTRWFHQQEHDYLKNVMEPESSGMEEENEVTFDNGIDERFAGDNSDVRIVKIDCASRLMNNVSTGNSRINTYDTELPQEIFQKSEDIGTSYHTTNSPSVVINNYVHHQEPVIVRQVIDPSTSRFNTTIVLQEEQNEPTTFHNDSFMIDESPKNVKLVTFPSTVKYNEKFILDESPHHQHQQQQQIHQATSSFRANGTTTSIQPIQNSYFVGGPNFAYISKMGNKIETTEPTRIIKQEANNNQGQMKQRIIYEIATEPKGSYDQHHVTYASQPQQEIFHQMVKHPNGTTTIYETTSAPSAKKTIIQRKKPNDPYTVQVMANNNTIILTPIGSSTQTVQQPQKSIVHIHRTTPMMQATSPPVQFITAPQTYLKKQTVIHPQQLTQQQKSQPKYTTVIRAPQPIPTITQQQPLQPQIITTVSSKIQRPIQKQKVIMSTSSLQQYRSYNQKSPASHGSRKQLHPQHIIRPAPSTTTSVIHHQMTQEQNPVIVPTGIPDHVIMSSPQMSINTSQIPSTQPTVLTIGPPGINNIYVRPKRPQQIFQPSHQQQQHLTNMTNMIATNAMNNLNNLNNLNNQLATMPPRMRHQQNHQRPPPGTVNLERSYQICQAVIQNSTNPNRQQLNNQLKPPPLMGQKKF